SPVYIDMGQSVDKRHPHAEEFLRRDLNVVTHFFGKKGLTGVKKQADDLFDELTVEDGE
ncbi:MAG: serine protein kinase RIO, partial [Thermoplasmata archaeon]|nr:serine protein kinase RIO [Thermoplasmata archaeon]